jgi:hypothetical protein
VNVTFRGFGIRILLLVLAAGLVLSISSAALGDGSPDQVVAWSGGVTGGCSAYVRETLTGSVTGCLPNAGPGGVYFSVAADGTIVVESGDGWQGVEGPIWLVHPDGNAIELDSSPDDFDPQISADGSKVTFERIDHPSWASDIYVVNSNGSGLTRVASGGTTTQLTDPVFSPDGGSIAYSCGGALPSDGGPLPKTCGPLADGSYRTSGLMLMNADGSNKRMILIAAGTGQAAPGSLSWSFDGKWLTVGGLAGSECSSGGSMCRFQLFAYHSDGSDLFNSLDPSRQISHSTGAYGAGIGQFCGDSHQVLYWDDNNGRGTGSWNFVNLDGSTAGPVALPAGETVACVPPGIGQGPPPTVNATRLPVPSVRALSLKAAKKRLAAADLPIGTVKHQYSAKVRKNRVLVQYPRAGAVAHRTVKIGPPVNLTLSRGPRHHRH